MISDRRAEPRERPVGNTRLRDFNRPLTRLGSPLALVPKLRLGTHVREAPLRISARRQYCIEGLRMWRASSTAKRGFAEVRSQAELGIEASTSNQSLSPPQSELITDAQHRAISKHDFHHLFAMHFAAFLIG